MSEINLQQKFPEMRPITKPPVLTTINGCGVAVYGRRDADLPRKRSERAISAALNPWSAADALGQYWAGQMVGEPSTARARLARIAEAGIPVPINPRSFNPTARSRCG